MTGALLLFLAWLPQGHPEYGTATDRCDRHVLVAPICGAYPMTVTYSKGEMVLERFVDVYHAFDYTGSGRIDYRVSGSHACSFSYPLVIEYGGVIWWEATTPKRGYFNLDAFCASNIFSDGFESGDVRAWTLPKHVFRDGFETGDTSRWSEEKQWPK